MGWKKLVLAAIAYAIISQVIFSLGALFADMPYYANPEYLGVWSKTMMPGPEPPPAQFYIFSTLAALVMGAIFAYGYSLVGPALEGGKSSEAKKPWKLGAKYGLLVFGLAGLSNLTLPLVFNIPFALGFSWAAQALVVNLAAGAAVGKIYGK